MLKRITLALLVILTGTIGAAAAITPAQAAPVGVYSEAFQATLVEINDLSQVDAEASLPGVVEVYRYDVSAAIINCPGGRYCAYTTIGFSGSMYMWSSAWNNKCVPVGGSFWNNVDSFANAMTGYQARLSSGPGCTVSTEFQVINPWTNDSDLAPYRSTLESFLTPFYG